MPDEKIVARCVDCSGEFTEQQIKGAHSCPSCGSDGVPVHPDNDVTVQVNWHELRILGIWAENWANHMGENKQTGRHPVHTIFSIAKRLQAQHPLQPPLTLSGEMEELKREYPGATVHGNLTPGGPTSMDSEKEN